MLSREEAWKKINELINNPNLIKHCLAVEAGMAAYADYFKVSGEEKEKWQVAGLLHDADYEKYPDKHPKVILEWLEEKGVGEDLINAVASHGFGFDVEPKTLMAKVLRAVDELTGLIVAVALVRESKKIADVRVKSVLRKWKDKSFAAGVKREDIERGAEDIGVDLQEHIAIVLQAMQGISDQLGL
jgi:putative nucleotidyltransferase with HDIG domain